MQTKQKFAVSAAARAEVKRWQALIRERMSKSRHLDEAEVKWLEEEAWLDSPQDQVHASWNVWIAGNANKTVQDLSEKCMTACMCELCATLYV